MALPSLLLGSIPFTAFSTTASGFLAQKIFGSLGTLSTRITGMAYILLFDHFITGKLHLFGIDHNHIITTVHMRSETWLMLSPEDHCYL